MNLANDLPCSCNVLAANYGKFDHNKPNWLINTFLENNLLLHNFCFRNHAGNIRLPYVNGTSCAACPDKCTDKLCGEYHN